MKESEKGSTVVPPSGQRGSSRAWRADKDLAERVCAGDDLALREFFQRYVDPVYSFIYYRVGGNNQDAEDILQETLITALVQLRSFQGESQLHTWLLGIAWHKVEDFYRRKQRLEKTMTQVVGSQKMRLGSTQANPLSDQIAETMATEQWVQNCLDKLPIDYQAALVLKYVEGFSMAEIARIMKRSGKAVESLLTRARKAFRVAMEQDRDGWKE